jgi:hypothetical protein
MNIQAHKLDFIDDLGRKVMLRGVNLAGSSKVPYKPDGSTYIHQGFFDHHNVSFVGRPFPLAQADEHLSRLREWGFNFLRLLVTWEAIEHAGPGEYDWEYLDYITEVVKVAAKYGFNLFIDPHQDVWSRFSGGDGAPGWTLEAAGFDLKHFMETGAAIVHATHGDPFPKMVWHTNIRKLACATMFTLFFGGNDFAPLVKVDGTPIQDYLQKHYLAAFTQLAMRIKDSPNVVGYDTLNEPSSGYIGWKDLDSLPGKENLWISPTPYQSMLLGSGMPQDVAYYELGMASIKQKGTRRLNEAREYAWLAGSDCIWRQHGVWDLDAAGEPHLLHPDYFYQRGGQPVSFCRDYYRPFANRFAAAIRSAHPEALIFVESEPDTRICSFREEDCKDLVFAPHWYDGYVLVQKHYSSFLAVNSQTRKVVVTAPAIRRSFARQLAWLKKQAQDELGGVPFVLGEFGICYDLQDKLAYRTGDFRQQIKALQRTYEAVETNLLDSTLWTYTPDNTNLHGDSWNDEDLSIYSPDQRTDPRDINSGGRALEAVVRPYPLATAGELLKASFNCHRRLFRMTFQADPAISAPTEIFIPNFQYPHGYSVGVSDGRYEIKRSQQLLLYWPRTGRSVHTITIKP